MINTKKLKLIIKLLIAILSLILLIKLISFTAAKYESFARSNADVDVAFYLLEKDYKTMTLNLDSLFPSSTPYTYKFSIGNTDGNKNAETDLEYELSIRTTTNLPIKYELYMNEEYTDTNAQNIIKTNEIKKDTEEDGTYFRYITTDKIELQYTNPETNLYQLVVYFPEEYNTEEYQDVIEAIEITVNSKQILEE
jgi:hypothetical protein